MSKIKKKVTYVNEEGFEFTFKPIEDTLQIKETDEGFEARYLVQDDNPESPDEWENRDLFLVGYHREFTVERDKIINKEQCCLLCQDTKDLEEHEKEWVRDFRKKYHVFGLEAYIHGGVALALSHEGDFLDRQWDVSQLGFVFAAKEFWKRGDSARKAALSLIEEWNQYLSGDVYGVVLEKYDKNKNQIGHDSCWGFYGEKYALKELPDYFG
jgi:hypothetical protein